MDQAGSYITIVSLLLPIYILSKIYFMIGSKRVKTIDVVIIIIGLIILFPIYINNTWGQNVAVVGFYCIIIMIGIFVFLINKIRA